MQLAELERAIADAGQRNDPVLPTLLSQLGAARRALGELWGAYTAYAYMVVLLEEGADDDRPHVLIARADLDSVAYELRWMMAVRCREDETASYSQCGVDFYDQLGHWWRVAGDWAQARRAFEQALAPEAAENAALKTALRAEESVRADKTRNRDHAAEVEAHMGVQRVRLEQALARVDANSPEPTALVFELAEALHGVGDWPAACAMFERGLALTARADGSTHPKLAAAWRRYGLLRHLRGELGAAGKAMQQALAIDEAVYGPDHRVVADDLNALGAVLDDPRWVAGIWGVQNRGDMARLGSLYQEILITAAQSGTSNDPRFIVRIGALKEALDGLGELPTARECYQRALAIDERAYGPQHPKVATDLNRLTTLLWCDGSLAQLKFDVEQAIHPRNGDSPHFPPAHQPIVQHLLSLLPNPSDVDALAAALEAALPLMEQTLGADHETFRAVAERAPLVVQAWRDNRTAAGMAAQALAIDERVYGPDHPTVARDVLNTINFHGESWLVDVPLVYVARAAVERALAIADRVYDLDHPLVSEIAYHLDLGYGTWREHWQGRSQWLRYSQLGLTPNRRHEEVARRCAFVFHRWGEWALAQTLYEQALAFEQQRDDPRPDILDQIATCLREVTEKLTAQQARNQVLEDELRQLERRVGPDHARVVRLLFGRVQVLKDSNDQLARRAAHEQLLAACERVYGPDALYIALGAQYLAGLLHEMGQTAEALPYLQRAEAIWRRVVPRGHFGHRVVDLTIEVWAEQVAGNPERSDQVGNPFVL